MEINSLEEQMNSLTFTSFIAGNLKDLFDQKFELYRQSLQQMQQIAPMQIQSQLEGTVDKFFQQIEANIRDVEQKVIQKIT